MNTNWRETVLKHLTSGTARVRVVSDPDGLLLDEELLHQLSQMGFSVLLYDDPWTFRLRYEEDFRDAWEHGRSTPRLLVRATSTNLDSIPFDVLDQDEAAYPSVSQLFSHLDRRIMAELDRRLYDQAFRVNGAIGAGRLNHHDTSLLILREIYFVDPTLVTTHEDVWALISQIHRLGYPLPESIADILTYELSPWQAEIPMPIRSALTSRRTWELALRHTAKAGEMMWGARYWLDLLGWDSEIGQPLSPVSSTLTRKLRALLHKEHLVGRDWLQHAEDIAMLRLSDYTGIEGVDGSLLQALDERFEDWVYENYGLLQSLPPYPEPVMVHQVVHYMAHQKDVVKWALLVVDGMSYGDWLYIRSLIDLSSYQVTECSVFAWVPTITSVSRKAIFSGRVPRDFGQSLGTTSGEDLLWHQFWHSSKGNAIDVRFQKAADTMNVDELLHLLSDGSPDVIGLVANMVDRLAHDANLGMPQFLSDVKLWVDRDGWLPRVIGGLVDQGFQVLITSDHGHVPVEGIGRPPTGDIPASKGQRVQVFPTKSLREQVTTEWGKPWPHLYGLPADYVPMLAPPNQAYASRGQQLLSHGGVSMEELMVPMIRIMR